MCKNANLAAHRVSYVIHFGKIDEGLHVLHNCNNAKCVNPGHLRLGTHLDNMRDRDLTGWKPKPLRGSLNGSSKLDEDKVLEVRSMFKSGISSASIAKRFGVSYQSIGKILARKTWTHV